MNNLLANQKIFFGIVFSEKNKKNTTTKQPSFKTFRDKG